MCPVCTIGVVVGLGLSRWLKVSDLISGLWIGALILVLTLWILKFLAKKMDFSAKAKLAWGILILVFIWAIVFVPMYYTGIIDRNCLSVFGIDYLTFSGFLGIAITGFALFLDKIIRKYNKGKVLFYYQSVILPLCVLVIASLILKLLC